MGNFSMMEKLQDGKRELKFTNHLGSEKNEEDAGIIHRKKALHQAQTVYCGVIGVYYAALVHTLWQLCTC